MFMVAYDPETDFTVQPWLDRQLDGGLNEGEVVGGSFISATEGEDNIRLYGYLALLRGTIKPTGTGLDQTLFFTLDTARAIAQASQTQAEKPLVIPEGKISAALLKVRPGTDLHDVSMEVVRTVPGVVPIKSGDLFQSSRKQLESLLKSLVAMMALIWPLAIVLIGMVYLMAANERRRELGMLRALGATRRFICTSLLTEAALLAFCGATVGALLSVMAIYLFRRLIVATLGVPFLLPSPGPLLLQLVLGLLLAMASVFIAALLPALKVSGQDPAIAMRE
jgi:putative ABC transport system permease protein